MGWTKRQFVAAAFEEIGMAEYVFDLSPEDLQGAVRRLDAMVAEWGGLGINIGYPLAVNPDKANLDSPTDVPISATNALFSNLSLRLAPTYGKVPSQETRIAAKNGYNILFARASQPPQMQFPQNTPAGAGNKQFPGIQNPFLLPPVAINIGKPQPDVELPQGI